MRKLNTGRNGSTKEKMKSMTELILSSRGSWGAVNPVTKVVRDRTKYSRKIKHKNKEV